MCLADIAAEGRVPYVHTHMHACFKTFWLDWHRWAGIWTWSRHLGERPASERSSSPLGYRGRLELYPTAAAGGEECVSREGRDQLVARFPIPDVWRGQDLGPGRAKCQVGARVSMSGQCKTLDQHAFEKRQPGFGRFDLMAQASEVDEDLYEFVIIVAVVHMYRPVDSVERFCCACTVVVVVAVVQGTASWIPISASVSVSVSASASASFCLGLGLEPGLDPDPDS